MPPLPQCLSYAPNKTAAVSTSASHSALSPNEVPKTQNAASAAEVYLRHLTQEGKEKSTLLRTAVMMTKQNKDLK